MRILLVIPTYNERDNISRLLSEVARQGQEGLDVLVVDDGSPDGTAALVKENKGFGQNIFLLERSGKQGLGTAYRDAFRWGLERDYDVFIEMDADFSHNPSHLHPLIKRIEAYDFVIGSRYVSGGRVENWSRFRKLVSSLGSLYARLVLGKNIRDFTGGFNVWRRSILEKVNLGTLSASGYFFQIELKFRALEAGGRFWEEPIIFKNREQGQSKISSRILREAFWRVLVLRWYSFPESYREFIKFSLVGASGFIVDFGLLVFFVETLGYSVFMANALSFSLAVINNFLWNKLWTFRQRSSRSSFQLGKFFSVSLVGLALNLFLMKVLVGMGIFYLGAKVIITFIVVAWNFFANRYWTFRRAQ